MTAYDVGLLILRVVLGLTMAAHGYNKFFGKGGLKGTAGWFDSMGMKPGMFHARIAATTEMAAGLGLAVGLLTPIPAAGFVAGPLICGFLYQHNPTMSALGAAAILFVVVFAAAKMRGHR